MIFFINLYELFFITSGKKKPVGGVSLFGEDVLSKKDTPAEKVPDDFRLHGISSNSNVSIYTLLYCYKL